MVGPPDAPRVLFEDLGRREYAAAWDHQTEVHRELVARKRSYGWARAPTPPPHRVLFVEHDHVYTLGKSGSTDHLLLDEAGLRARGVAFHRINRGGDITYHGPGQLVGYPILDLDWFFHDVRRYVWSLEESVIRTLRRYGVAAERYEGYTGVWLPPQPAGEDLPDGLPWRKICAIGVHLSRWVTLHGFAFNVATDLSYFRGIVPCGIARGDHEVTSLTAELGRVVEMEEVKAILREALAEVLGFEWSAAGPATARSGRSPSSSPAGSPSRARPAR